MILIHYNSKVAHNDVKQQLQSFVNKTESLQTDIKKLRQSMEEELFYLNGKAKKNDEHHPESPDNP